MAPSSFSSSERRINQVVREIIAEQLGVDENDLEPDSSFVEDLGADSLDIVELIMALEEEFEMEISDQDAEKILTVKDALDYVRKRIQ